ncbi:hypothetical protein ACFUIW_19515 [Streptomyces sp. NPDC057245]|uniref:effector-associated constant component EACC1 n=1 Tax=Streptomyces sp. NPDC057245 TaxID=3346065 RepID=UPI0036412EA1
MLVQLRAEPDDDVRTALDLYAWLRGDPDVRAHAEVGIGPSEPGGETMGAAEVVNLVVGQTFAALNLALAYASWRQARPAAPAVTLTVDGRSLTVEGASQETLRQIVELLGEPRTDGTQTPPVDGPRDPGGPRPHGDGTPGPG